MTDNYGPILAELRQRAKEARQRRAEADREAEDLSTAIKAIERLRGPKSNGAEPDSEVTSKDMVAIILKASDTPLTVQEIEREARNSGMEINLNTLRWALHAWQQEGVVMKHGSRRYYHRDNAFQALSGLFGGEGGEEEE